MEDISIWEGAREAWAMVKTWYTKLDPNHMARVGPLGSDGKVAAKYSQRVCKLDNLLDGIEEEIFESK